RGPRPSSRGPRRARTALGYGGRRRARPLADARRASRGARARPGHRARRRRRARAGTARRGRARRLVLGARRARTGRRPRGRTARGRGSGGCLARAARRGHAPASRPGRAHRGRAHRRRAGERGAGVRARSGRARAGPGRGHAAMRIRPILRVAWRWSWLVTLPVTVAAFVWLRTTVARYRSFRVEQATLHDFRLTTVGRMTAGEMLRHLELDWTRLGGAPPIPGVRTLDVHAPDVLFARLDADLPHSGPEYLTDAIPTGGSAPPIVKKVWAMLGAGGDSWRVQLRYRGDNVYHWGYRKKSLRLRTDKDRLFEGMRAFNLIAPRTPALLNNYLAFRLAHRLGLIAPRVELAELRINGVARGLYVLTEQPDEATLRAHG